MPAGGTPTDPAELAGLVGNYRLVSPDYFETLGMVLTRGRLFTGQDRGRPVAVVTAQTASRLWPGEDPIGQRFLRGNSPDRPSQEVVGVVADARILGLDVDPGLVAYLPYWELAPSNATVVARGGADTATVLAALRESVRGLDPLLPVSNARVLDDVLAASVAVRRFLLQVTAGFAVGGLVLVCLGVFGTVSQRVVRPPARVRHPAGSRRHAEPHRPPRVRAGAAAGRCRSGRRPRSRPRGRPVHRRPTIRGRPRRPRGARRRRCRDARAGRWRVSGADRSRPPGAVGQGPARRLNRLDPDPGWETPNSRSTSARPYVQSNVQPSGPAKSGRAARWGWSASVKSALSTSTALRPRRGAGGSSLASPAISQHQRAQYS